MTAPRGTLRLPRRLQVWPLWLGALMPLLLLIAWAAPSFGPASSYALFGRVPWSDGFDYWSAAQHLMQLGHLDEWGSRRPLNGAFLAARLMISCDSLFLALLVQSLLLGLAMVAFARGANAAMGRGAAIVAALAMVAAGALVQSTTQSEGFGLLLGCAAFGLLVPSVMDRRETQPQAPRRERGWVSALLGLAILAVAMAARPGAILMVPLLALWSMWRWRSKKLRVVLFLAAAIAGVALDGAARSLYGMPGVGGNANFSGTVLGLARGTDYYEATGWLSPQLPAGASEHARADLAYSEAWRLVRADPGVAALALARNLGRFAIRLWPVIVLATIGVIRSPRRERAFWLVGWGGVLLSVPIIFGDGGFRCLAACWPFFAASAASAFRRRDGEEPAPAGVLLPGVLAAGLALVIAIFAPLLRHCGVFRAVPPPLSIADNPLPMVGAEEVDWIRNDPAIEAILVASESQAGAAPRLFDRFRRVERRSLAQDAAVIEFGEPVAEAGDAETPYLLAAVYDINQSRARFFTLPANAETAAALSSGLPALRVDSVSLTPGSRFRVAVKVTARGS